MSKEKEYHELYDRLMAEVAALHQSNRRRIRSGMRMLVVVTVGLMLLMFLAEGNKVFTLMLWIAAMFGVASYLIAVEYADYELQKKVEQITQMEQESLGALLALALAGWVSAALPWLMSAAAGCMVCVTAQEMIPEAVEADEPAGVISVVAGFALMMALDVAL